MGEEMEAKTPDLQEAKTPDLQEEKVDDGDEEMETESPSGPASTLTFPLATGPDVNLPPPVSPANSISTTASTTKELKKNGEPKKRTLLQKSQPTDAEWEKFIATFEDLPHGIKKEEYTIELMREVERRYWRTLTFGESPMYGADMAGAFFHRTFHGAPDLSPWRLTLSLWLHE